LKATQKTVVTGVEMFNKELDKGQVSAASIRCSS
jgi:translation elongation factor EF-Tu-like GTPase